MGGEEEVRRRDAMGLVWRELGFRLRTEPPCFHHVIVITAMEQPGAPTGWFRKAHEASVYQWRAATIVVS